MPLDSPGTPNPVAPEPPSSGLSWTAMLAIIAFACALAGIIAYRLVTPFFPHH